MPRQFGHQRTFRRVVIDLAAHRICFQIVVARLPQQIHRRRIQPGFPFVLGKPNRRTVVDLGNVVIRISRNDRGAFIELDRSRLIAALLVSQEPADKSPIIISIPLRLGRRGVETKLILNSNHDASNRCDEALIHLVSRSRHWFDEIIRGEIDSVLAIAEREGIDPSDVGRDLQLAFLAPEIIDSILTGNQPVELTANRLRLFGTLPLDWNRQRELLGFAPKSSRICPLNSVKTGLGNKPLETFVQNRPARPIPRVSDVLKTPKIPQTPGIFAPEKTGR